MKTQAELAREKRAQRQEGPTQPLPDVKRSARRGRHWRQRFNARADFVFLRRMRMGDEHRPYFLPGEQMPRELRDKLGKARLRRMWESKLIGLSGWFLAPTDHGVAEHDPELLRARMVEDDLEQRDPAELAAEVAEDAPKVEGAPTDPEDGDESDQGEEPEDSRVESVESEVRQTEAGMEADVTVVVDPAPQAEGDEPKDEPEEG